MRLRIAKKMFFFMPFAIVLLILFCLPQILSPSFNLDNYKNQRILEEKIYDLFPTGTHKDYLEKTIVNSRVRVKKADPSGKIVRYVTKPPLIDMPPYSIWVLHVKYDEQDKVSHIEIDRVEHLFAHSVWEDAAQK